MLLQSKTLGFLMLIVGKCSAMQIRCYYEDCTIEHLTNDTWECLFPNRSQPFLYLTVARTYMASINLRNLQTGVLKIQDSYAGRLIIPSACNLNSLEVERVRIGKLEMDWNEHLLHVTSSRALIGSIDWLTNLTALETVTISRCHLKSVSLDLFRNAPNLKIMELIHAQIDQLHFPEERHQCCGNLTELNLSYNNLPAINLTQFSELSSLSWLSIAFNRINQLLATLTTKSLVGLDLSGNQITTIELCQWNATSLTKLNLSQNRLNHMFRCVNRLEALRYLELNNNSIIKVDFAMFASNSINRLNLASNNISEVLNRQSIARDTYLIMDEHSK